METVNTIAGAASRAIWGNPESNQEPVSGEKGAGTLNEPYDKGNDDAATKSAAKSTHVNQQGANRPGATPDAASTSAIENKKEAGEFAAQDKSEKPKIPHSDMEREALAAKGEFPHDPNDHSGEPMHMHDGSDSQARKKADRNASVAQEGGGKLGEGPKGTGELHVKSTGMAADGGDFDAAKPGAVTEANRLMEEGEGMHKSDKNSGKSESPSPSEKAGKASKLGRLKEKLHLKHRD